MRKQTKTDANQDVAGRGMQKPGKADANPAVLGGSLRKQTGAGTNPGVPGEGVQKQRGAKPDVSIVMPNYNSPVVDKSIEAIMAQSFNGSFEIIVVGMDSLNLIKPNKKLKFVRTREKTVPSKARNIGIGKAMAGTIVFVDSDCIPERKWLEALMGNRAKIVTGAVEFEAGNFWTTCDNFIHFHASNRKRKAGEIPLFGTMQLKIPKKKLAATGLFDEKLETGEDLDLALRLKEAGERFFFEPKAVVKHLPERKSLGSVLRHSAYWARDSMKVRLKHKTMPGLLKNRWLALALSPFAALWVTIGIYSRPYNLGYIHLLPVVWLAKLSWFYGAFRGLKNA